MSIGGFFLLLFIVWALRFLGNRFARLLMPKGRLRCYLWGFLGGLGGSLALRFFWPWGPKLGGIYIVGAADGAALALLTLGLAPFVKILLGKG